MENCTVPLKALLAPKADFKLRQGLLLTYLKTIRHVFTACEFDKLQGELRRGNLSIAQSDIVSAKLKAANDTGCMSINDYRQLYQFYSLLKKYPEAGSDAACKDAAVRKLLAGELSCLNVNNTIQSRIKHNYAFFDRVKRIIFEIIGTVPNNILNKEVFFGPGSTVNADNRSVAETAMFFKLSDKLIVPEKACKYLAAHLSYQPNWVDTLGTHYHLQKDDTESRLAFELRVFKEHFVIVDDDYPSRIGFVPKNAEEHRTIGIELNGLVPLQKILGDYFRLKLKHFGINLDSQDRNKHLARMAKVFGLSTIDLANASSSISLELVRAIFPTDWFILLDAFRSSHGENQALGLNVEYAMISSMGNGFTFELESLIFYALARACAEENGMPALEMKRSISIYGDDIIIPKSISADFLKRLTLFGFTANVDKSFFKGFFFESCGSDYYQCTDVRPFFLKRRVTRPIDVMFLMNSLMFKAITQCRLDYIPMYESLFKRFGSNVLLGPLHFDSSVHGRLKTDDLEAVLRVPLDIAQRYGGVKTDKHTFGVIFSKWVRVAVECDLGKSRQYAVRHMKYLTFLRGNIQGKVLMRGQGTYRKVSAVTSSWDGNLTVKELRIANDFFNHLAIASDSKSHLGD